MISYDISDSWTESSDLKGKFTEVCRHYSKEHRGLHIHFTSVIVRTLNLVRFLSLTIIVGYQSHGKDSCSRWVPIRRNAWISLIIFFYSTRRYPPYELTTTWSDLIFFHSYQMLRITFRSLASASAHAHAQFLAFHITLRYNLRSVHFNPSRCPVVPESVSMLLLHMLL